MTITPETRPRPGHYLTAIASSADHARRLNRDGQTGDALEHLAAIDRLAAAYRSAVGEVQHDAIHKHFSLSYANYLALPRTLLQSMPDEWQSRFVAMLDELNQAFQHVPQAEAYKVEAGVEREVGDLDDAERNQLGITVDWYRGETPPDGLDAEDLAEWQEAHEDPEGPVYYRDGDEIDRDDLVILPAADPVPHYNRGRTRVEPRLGGDA